MRPDESPLSKKSVLYLEDEVLIAIDVSYFLQETGFGTVCVKHRLADAWSASEKSAFDIALLDINVDRGQSSIELGQYLSKQGIPVIFVSGNSANKESLIEDGFAFINKPFSHEKLREAIDAAVV